MAKLSLAVSPSILGLRNSLPAVASHRPWYVA